MQSQQRTFGERARRFALRTAASVATTVVVVKATQWYFRGQLQRSHGAHLLEPSGGYILRVDLPMLVPEIAEPKFDLGAFFRQLKQRSSSKEEKDRMRGVGKDRGVPWRPSNGHVDLLMTLRRAQQDPRIKGVVFVVPPGYHASVPGARGRWSDLRDAIAGFHHVWFWSSSYSSQGIALATSDPLNPVSEQPSEQQRNMLTVPKRPHPQERKAFLQRSGDILLFSPASTKFFFKNLLDKLGVEIDLVRSDDRKSATNALTETALTEKDREDTTRLLQASHNYDQRVSRSARVADDGPLTASAAVSKGLVSGIRSLEEVLDEAISVGKDSTGGQLKVLDVDHYANGVAHELVRLVPQQGLPEDVSVELAKNLRNRIAVVSCEGVMDTPAMAHHVRSGIFQAARDPTVSSIVVRINSPGGAVSVAESIAGAIWHAKKISGKPVIASVSDLCASGGYLVAAACDKVICSRGSLVGSLGAFLAVPHVAQGLAEHLGITTDTVELGKMAVHLGVLPLSDEVRAALKRGLDEMVEDFATLVYDTRFARGQIKAPVSKAQMENALITGQVWFAEHNWDAVRLPNEPEQVSRLWDHVGGLSHALRVAAMEAKAVSIDYAITQVDVFPAESNLVEALLGGPDEPTDYIPHRSPAGQGLQPHYMMLHVDALDAALAEQVAALFHHLFSSKSSLSNAFSWRSMMSDWMSEVFGRK